VYIWSPEKSTPEVQLKKPGESVVLAIKWSNNCGGDDSMLAAGCQDGQILIYNVKLGTVCMKLDAHDTEIGLRTMAFSPNNQMLATGGEDNLIIWSLMGHGSIIKHFQRPNGQQPGVNNYGMMGMAPGSGQSGNPMDEQYAQRMSVQDLNWSPDTMLLGAAINDYVGIFDMSKILQRVPMLGM